MKVCCISDRDELKIALDAGVDLVGFVAEPLGGGGVLPEDHIADLIAAVPPGFTPVLVTGETDLERLQDQVRRCRPGALQLVRSTTVAARRALRTSFGALRLIQVVHVVGRGAIDDASDAAAHSDALLLDSAADGLLGATGNTHDWSVSRAIVEAAPIPVFLAGGLRADNVAEAVATVRPHGVDLCTGVRPRGVLDPDTLTRFLNTARGGLEP